MLKVLTINQPVEWDSIVKSFENYDVYYLSGYVKAFMIHGDGAPLLIYYEDNNGKGINVVMKRDIAIDKRFENKIEKNQWFDFATPYGYGGWLTEGDIKSDIMMKEYGDWCRANNIVSEFVRFHPILNNWEAISNYYQVQLLGETVSIDLSNKDEIWSNFSSKNRNVIRKAEKNGIIIRQGLNKEIFDVFMNIYNKTMDKDNADLYYYFKEEFYDSIREDLKDNSTVFYAEYNEMIIAASIILFANEKLNYHLSGSLKEYQHLAPSNLLLSEVSKWGSDNGFKSFHLGGGVGSKEDSLLHFKKAFYKGPLCRYAIGKKIFNSEMYEALMSMRDDIENQGYFPQYRG